MKTFKWNSDSTFKAVTVDCLGRFLSPGFSGCGSPYGVFPIFLFYI